MLKNKKQKSSLGHRSNGYYPIDQLLPETDDLAKEAIKGDLRDLGIEKRQKEMTDVLAGICNHLSRHLSLPKSSLSAFLFKPADNGLLLLIASYPQRHLREGLYEVYGKFSWKEDTENDIQIRSVSGKAVYTKSAQYYADLANRHDPLNDVYVESASGIRRGSLFDIPVLKRHGDRRSECLAVISIRCDEPNVLQALVAMYAELFSIQIEQIRTALPSYAITGGLNWQNGKEHGNIEQQESANLAFDMAVEKETPFLLRSSEVEQNEQLIRNELIRRAKYWDWLVTKDRYEALWWLQESSISDKIRVDWAQHFRSEPLEYIVNDEPSLIGPKEHSALAILRHRTEDNFQLTPGDRHLISGILRQIVHWGEVGVPVADLVTQYLSDVDDPSARLLEVIGELNAELAKLEEKPRFTMTITSTPVYQPSGKLVKWEVLKLVPYVGSE